LNDAGDELVARAAIGLPQEVTLGPGIRAGRGVTGRVVAEGLPVVIDDLTDSEVAPPTVREPTLRSMVAVPMRFGTQVLGVLHVWSH
jgi:phosphoserine phosphatase RsbU/P